ncbi:MAG: glycosyltransferase family 9 protein [Candidatus Omnitrophica bacterium]|nr:glycosyltransferase family 9 protein [Candidatus Omnitrophota bacterium]
MTVGWMRRLDFWIGVPVCFFLSIFQFLQKPFQKNPAPGKPLKKVLFLELSEIGSTILSYPAMQKLKELYPESELYFWIFADNQDAVHVLGTVARENVLTIRTGSFWAFCKDVARNLQRIRREQIDAVVDMELFSRSSSILSFLTRAPFRIGFGTFAQEGLYRGRLRTHEVSYNPYQHIAQNYIALIYALKSLPGQYPCVKENWQASPVTLTLPVLESPEGRKAALMDILRRENPHIDHCRHKVVIHPGIHEALPLRQWPIENYGKLAEKLSSRPDVMIIFAGVAGKAKDAGRDYERLRGPRTINLIGKTRIPDLIDLCNLSHLLISHDGGLIHIASLTRIPVIAIFGPETPVLYGPLKENKVIFYRPYSCSPCLTAYNHRISYCKENRCVRSIPMEEVYQSAVKILNQQLSIL